MVKNKEPLTLIMIQSLIYIFHILSDLEFPTYFPMERLPFSNNGTSKRNHIRFFVPSPNSVELRDVFNGDVQSSIALDNSHCFSERDSVSNKCAKIKPRVRVDDTKLSIFFVSCKKFVLKSIS